MIDLVEIALQIDESLALVHVERETKEMCGLFERQRLYVQVTYQELCSPFKPAQLLSVAGEQWMCLERLTTSNSPVVCNSATWIYVLA